MSALASSGIAAVALMAVALITFALNRRLQLESTWRTEKLEYYKELMDSLAQNVEGMASLESHREFARASNNLLLIAPFDVLEAHQRFREHISLSNVERDYTRDADLLAALINAIRADLKMPGSGSITPEKARMWTHRHVDQGA